MKYFNKELYGGVIFPYRKALYGELFFFFLICIAMPLLLWFIIDFRFPFLVFGFVVFSFTGCTIISLPVLFEYLDYKNFSICSDEIVFHDAKYSYRIPNQDPIDNAYSKFDEHVFRIVFKGRLKNNSKNIFVRCIVSESRNQLLKDLLFPKITGGSVKECVNQHKLIEDEYFQMGTDCCRKKTSYPLRVYYTKYNHYLVRIELIDGIDYPENFTTLVKRANEFV